MSRDSALVYAEHRLDGWAKWARDHKGLGYPRISSLYRAMAQRLEPKKAEKKSALTASGKQTESFIPSTSELVPEPIAETDAVVAKLPKNLHIVIFADYFTYGPIEVRASRTPWGRARYCQLLEAAKYAVYIALDSEQLRSRTL